MQTPPSSPSNRREFFKKAAAIVTSVCALAVPAVAGLLVLLDPLRRKAARGDVVRVATLDALPEDGSPRKFPVLATRVDAWTRTRHVPVGAVYLRRTGPATVQALNVVCPHAGCFVDYAAGRNHFHCPCHNSSFALDGSIADPRSPSPRALDALPVEIRDGNEIWVTFRNYRAGVKEQVPV